MKAIHCLLMLSLSGWAFSDQAFKTGKTYHYQVHGRLMNGLTEISNQFAGLEISYKVLLTVTGPNTVNFKPIDVKLYEVHDVLQGGWKDGELPNAREVVVNQEIRGYLESPMDITFTKGIVESIKVDNNLPVWAVNMKKAQASDFVLDTTGVNIIVEGNLNRKTGHQLPEDFNNESGYHYQTLEKTIHGECPTYYTVSQNGAFSEPMPFHQQHQPGVPVQDDEPFNPTRINTNQQLVGELPWHYAYHTFCEENDQVYEVIKTINTTACYEKPVYSFFSPAATPNAYPRDKQFGASNGLHAIVSRVLACGKTREQFTILNVNQEEQVKVGLHATKKIMAGAIKNLTLIEITDAVSPVQVQNPKVINTLVYRFSQEQELNPHNLDMPQMDAAYMMDFEEMGITEEFHHSIVNEQEPAQLPSPSLTEAPVNPTVITPLRKEEMKKRIVVLIREIVNEIANKNGNIQNTETYLLPKITIVAKIFRFLSYSQVEELYREIAAKYDTQEEQMIRQVFLDCVSLAGTNPTIKFLLDLIQKREISGEQVSQVLMTLPLYIRTPTNELLKYYFNFIKSDVLQANKQGKTTALLSFSNILHDACVNSQTRQHRYPQVFGKLCDDQVVEQEYIPYFVQELERVINVQSQTDLSTHWKLVYLTVLGNIGHPTILPIVQKYMDNIQDPVIKVRVVLALQRMTVSRGPTNEQTTVYGKAHKEVRDVVNDRIVKEKVMPILLSAAFDKGEHPDVRMAAITLLFQCSSADLAIYQQLAYMTWFPTSHQVHSLIYNWLKNVAQLQHQTHPYHKQMQVYARQVLPICKPIEIGFQSSRSLFTAEYVMEFLTGYYTQFVYFGSEDSYIPRMMYFKDFEQVGGQHGFGTNNIEFTLYGNTIQKLWNHFSKQFFPESPVDQEFHEDFSRIQDLLNIKDRKQKEAVEGYFYLRIRNELERFVTLNKNQIDQFSRQFISEYFPKLQQGLPLNYQKTLNLGEYSLEIPTIFGLPLHYEHQLPVHVNVQGTIKLLPTEENKSNLQLQLDLHPTFVLETDDKLKVKIPFLRKSYESSVRQHTSVQFPFRASIQKTQQNQIILAVTPAKLQDQETNTELHLFTYHRYPYTAVIVDEFWPFNHNEVGNVKLIRTVGTPYTKEIRFGERQVGLSFHLQQESDYNLVAQDNKWFHFLSLYYNPNTYFQYGLAGVPSTEFVKRTFSLDLSQSQTNTVVFVLAGNLKTYLQDSRTIHNIDSTNYAANSDEYQFAFALIGKKEPIRPIGVNSGVRNILAKGTPSTFAYFTHFVYNDAIQGKFVLRYVAGEACREAVSKLPQEIQQFQVIREYLSALVIEGQQYKQCHEILTQWEVPNWPKQKEVVTLRQHLLSNELVLNVNSQIRLGENCEQQQSQINVNGQWKRGDKMTEWAQTKSPEAKRCIEDEKKGFQISPICVWVAQHQAAALNMGNFEVEYAQNTPSWFKNFSYKFEDLLKSIFYTQVQHNRYVEGVAVSENKLKINFEIAPKKNYITLSIYKPNEKIEFNDIQTPVELKQVFPLTAIRSIYKNFADRTVQYYSQQYCAVEGKWISTFDNVTYTFANAATGCEHLLTKDCSGKYPMAVLVKDIQTERKSVTVLLGGKTKIQIVPTTRLAGLRRGDFKVKVNDEQISQLPYVVRHQTSQEFIAVIEKMVNGGVQVRSNRLKVATDGSRIVVYGHNDYRGKLCGICGNADYETNAELRSPANCPLSSGSLLVASYAIENFNQQGGQCQPNPEIKSRLEKENSDCQQTSQYVNGFPQIMITENQSNECYISQRLVKRFPGVGICYSERSLNQCAPQCNVRSTVQKDVLFKCYNKGHPTTFSSYVEKQITLDIPSLCEQN